MGKTEHMKKHRTRDAVVLTVLIVVLLFLVIAKDRGMLNGAVTGKALQGQGGEAIFQEETWDIYTCDATSAQSAAQELVINYGCDTEYCTQAAYGTELPYGVVVELRCGSENQREIWIRDCQSYYAELC